MSGTVVGFYGKLPVRGDFVRDGLPRDFTDVWDDWLQRVMAGSRALLGDAWLPAYLEAPVWRFSLPAGICGECAALGLMLPSVDKAGRYFPLTFAALRAEPIPIDVGEAWLDRCEAAGRAALEQDCSPQEIAAMLGTLEPANDAAGSSECIWWTEGSVRMEPARLRLNALPDAATYAAMIGVSECRNAEVGETRWESMP